VNAIGLLAAVSGVLLFLVVVTGAAIALARSRAQAADLALADLCFSAKPSPVSKQFVVRRKAEPWDLVARHRSTLESFVNDSIDRYEIRGSYLDELARTDRRVHAALYLMTFRVPVEDDARLSKAREAAEWYRAQVRRLHPTYLRPAPELLDLSLQFLAASRMAERAEVIASQPRWRRPDEQ
jgi:hypothetical protein